MRVDPFLPSDLTRDAMLGGKVTLLQPKQGYRAGVDPVLLAAAVAAAPGQSVLELGTGAGAGLCCLGARVPSLRLTGLEVQPGYAALARQNIAENGLTGTIFEADLADPPAEVKAQSFDHVFANPPYFVAGARVAADRGDREIALAGATPLDTWVDTAARRLKPRGYATFIQRAERLPELMAAFHKSLGSLELMPLLPRAGRAPRLILLRGRKEGRAPFRFHPGVILHAGDVHKEPGLHYTPRIEDVLMRGAKLAFSAEP